MLKVNLIPWRQRAIQRSAKRSGYALLLSLLILLPYFWLSFVLISKSNQQLRQQITLWKQATQQATEWINRWKAIQQEAGSLINQERELKQRYQQAIHWQEFITEMGKIIPDPLWLTSLKKSEEKMTITGKSRDIASVSLFRQQLEQQSLFSQVEQGNIEKEDDLDLRFSLDIILANRGIKENRGGEDE